MVWEDNMLKTHKPQVSKNYNKAYVKVTFRPDYERLGLTGLTDDILKLMIKRIYDISACSNTAVTVYYNNKKIKQKTFLQYANLYTNNEDIVKIHEIVNDRWEIIACLNQYDVFSHVSFVNGISTIHGTHVNYIQDQIVKKISAIIKKKKLDTVIKNSFIKNKLRLFIKCFIENP